MVSSAFGSGGLSLLSPTPPAVMRVPLSQLAKLGVAAYFSTQSSWPPADEVIWVPLTSTVLNWPTGW